MDEVAMPTCVALCTCIETSAPIQYPFLPQSTDVNVEEKTERLRDPEIVDEYKEIVFSRHHRSLAPISSL